MNQLHLVCTVAIDSDLTKTWNTSDMSYILLHESATASLYCGQLGVIRYVVLK